MTPERLLSEQLKAENLPKVRTTLRRRHTTGGGEEGINTETHQLEVDKFQRPTDYFQSQWAFWAGANAGPIGNYLLAALKTASPSAAKTLMTTLGPGGAAALIVGAPILLGALKAKVVVKLSGGEKITQGEQKKCMEDITKHARYADWARFAMLAGFDLTLTLTKFLAGEEVGKTIEVIESFTNQNAGPMIKFLVAGKLGEKLSECWTPHLQFADDAKVSAKMLMGKQA